MTDTIAVAAELSVGVVLGISLGIFMCKIRRGSRFIYGSSFGLLLAGYIYPLCIGVFLHLKYPYV